jgi:hypothetical protein
VVLEAGHLVSMAELRQALSLALAEQARFFDQLAGRLCVHGLVQLVEDQSRGEEMFFGSEDARGLLGGGRK